MPILLPRDRLIEELVAYEQSHAVEEYEADGWNVWPLLRFSVAMQNQADRQDVGRRRSSSRRAVGWLQTWVNTNFRDRQKSLSAAKQSDVLILTHSNRRERIGQSLRHRLADPLAVSLAGQDLSCAIFELGDPRWPRYAPSTWIETALRLRRIGNSIRRKKNRGSSSPPPWFGEFAAWSQTLQDRPYRWDHWCRELDVISALRAVFTDWMERIECRMVFIDCWYSCRAIAATLAASDLGLRSIELQHGSQGGTHYAYAHWSKVPEGGFQAMPQTFWHWGNRDASSFVATNPKGPSSIVGGYPWLNQWIRPGDAALEQECSAAHRLKNGVDLTVAATLQPDVPVSTVTDAIRQSPRRWRWILRLHPRHASEAAKQALLQRIGSGDVDRVHIQTPSDMPLHALFHAADVHVTGFSTCAVEALPYGVPTVCFHPHAKTAFGQDMFLDNFGFAETPEEMLEQIERSADRDREQLIAAGRTIFASEEHTDAAIRTLREQSIPAHVVKFPNRACDESMRRPIATA